MLSSTARSKSSRISSRDRFRRTRRRSLSYCCKRFSASYVVDRVCGNTKLLLCRGRNSSLARQLPTRRCRCASNNSLPRFAPSTAHSSRHNSTSSSITSSSSITISRYFAATAAAAAASHPPACLGFGTSAGSFLYRCCCCGYWGCHCCSREGSEGGRQSRWHEAKAQGVEGSRSRRQGPED